MKKNIFRLFLITSLSFIKTIGYTSCFAQTFDCLWAKSAGSSFPDQCNSVATDAFGNSYVTGSFQGLSITFGSVTLTNADNLSGTADIFVVKYDSLGNVLWAKRAGGPNWDAGSSISIDPEGNVLVTGNYNSPVVIFGTDTLINAVGSGYSADVFLVKYDSSGTVLWADGIGGNASDNGRGVCTDRYGNVIITGSFESTAMTVGGTLLVSSGNADVFLVKYSPSGNPLWAKKYGDYLLEVGVGVASDVNQNILLTGDFTSSSVHFDTTVVNNALPGNVDLFIAKCDSLGNVLWVKSAGGYFNDVGTSITSDQNGNVLVTGAFASPAITLGGITVTNAGGTTNASDAFLAKFDPVGNTIWLKNSTDTYSDLGQGVSCDKAGNTTITGFFWGTTIEFGSFILTNSHPSFCDIFIAKYSGSGNVLFAREFGGERFDYGYSVCTDINNDIIVAGSFDSPEISFGEIVLTDVGYDDALVFKPDGRITDDSENNIVIPNVFTPNGDNENDYFFIKNLQPGVANLKIYNRWGNLIYSALGYNNDWSGTNISDGVYYYVIDDPKHEKVYKGFIQLIRGN